MEEWLNGLKPDAWYKVVTITGGLAVAASISASFGAGTFIGLGLLGIGCGEWTSRVTTQRPTPAGMGIPAGVLRVKTRVWRPLGIVLDVGGVVLLAIGVFRLF